MRGQAALKIVDPVLMLPLRQSDAIPSPPASLARETGGPRERPAWLFRGLFAVNLSMWLSILLAIRALI